MENYTLKAGINNIDKQVNIVASEITGDVTIEYTSEADLNLPAGLKITGNLTVNAPKATVNNNATVTGTITIKDVKAGTWNELVSANKLVFEAAGKTLKINDTVVALTINANATVITPKTVNAVVKKDVTVIVKADATVSDDKAVKIVGTESEEPVELDPKETPEVKYSITFSVTPEDAKVVVKKGEDTISAEEDGTYKLQTGEYSYTVTKEGYVEKTGSFTVAEEAKTITVELQKETVIPTTQVITFSVTPEDAKVVVKKGEDTISAEEDGTYKLQTGEYSYTVTKEGYVEKTGSFTVAEEAKTITVELQKEILKAPEDGAKVVENLEGVTDGVLFLVAGLNVEGTNRQKPSTLEDVKKFIDKEYGVNFNKDVIKVTEGKIEITGSILSGEDWNKIKSAPGANKTIPYRITLVKAGTSADEGKVQDDAKVAKIAMYEDGNAVIEVK
ncbi:hypothetical protein [Tissierella praeacuta]|uniref:hypothetical protein n=1 Tax=Tissierella praeacuta TaxID=43131 RepID=UPI002FDAE848